MQILMLFLMENLKSLLNLFLEKLSQKGLLSLFLLFILRLLALLAIRILLWFPISNFKRLNRNLDFLIFNKSSITGLLMSCFIKMISLLHIMVHSLLIIEQTVWSTILRKLVDLKYKKDTTKR